MKRGSIIPTFSIDYCFLKSIMHEYEISFRGRTEIAICLQLLFKKFTLGLLSNVFIGPRHFDAAFCIVTVRLSGPFISIHTT